MLCGCLARTASIPELHVRAFPAFWLHINWSKNKKTDEPYHPLLRRLAPAKICMPPESGKGSSNGMLIYLFIYYLFTYLLLAKRLVVI